MANGGYEGRQRPRRTGRRPSLRHRGSKPWSIAGRGASPSGNCFAKAIRFRPRRVEAVRTAAVMCTGLTAALRRAQIGVDLRRAQLGVENQIDNIHQRASVVEREDVMSNPSMASVPKPYNEPVRTYEPGSPARSAIEFRLRAM